MIRIAFRLRTPLLIFFLALFGLCPSLCAVAAKSGHSCCPEQKQSNETAKQCCTSASYFSKSEIGVVVKASHPVSPPPFFGAPQAPRESGIRFRPLVIDTSQQARFRDLIRSLSASPNAPPVAIQLRQLSRRTFFSLVHGDSLPIRHRLYGDTKTRMRFYKVTVPY